MRVLQLCCSNGFYGAERVVLLLASRLKDSGCAVTLGLFNAGRTAQQEFRRGADEAGVPVLDLPCSGRLDVRTIGRLVHHLRTTRTDVIHTHGYKANVYGLIAGRAAGCSVIATCHNWTESTASLRWYAAFDRALLRGFDRVVAVSDTVASTLARAGLRSPRVRVIHNGVDTTRFRARGAPAPMGGSRIRIGVLSRLSSEKGVDVLVRALPQVLKNFPEMECVVIGEGPERTTLTELAASLGVTDHLSMPGYLDDSAAFLGTCSLVVHPSRVEGMPLAVLEAMAAGRPIVATRVGGIPGLLQEGLAGVLAAPGDPAALAEAILIMLADKALRDRCAANAAAHAKSFDAVMMAAAYQDAYVSMRGPQGMPGVLPACA